jgi:hypothetical protein
MAHAYRTVPCPRGGPRLTAARRAATVGAALVGLIAAVAWLGAAWHAQAASGARAFALARGAITVGMSRADCYAWLRAHDLVATNIGYGAWSKNRYGAWFRSSDGAWPLPARAGAARRSRLLDEAHPDVELKLWSGAIAGCGMTIVEHISFDRDERIARISPSDPYWSCG